jgi:isopenicillin N synthase-like dioxygenase
MLPVCAVALDLPPEYFDRAFAESQLSFRLSHYPPITYEAYLLWWYDANYNAALQSDRS